MRSLRYTGKNFPGSAKGKVRKLSLAIAISAVLLLYLLTMPVIRPNRTFAYSPMASVTTFSDPSYTVTFEEIGLPLNSAEWSVILGNTTVTSNGSSISISKPNGTYGWAASSISYSLDILGYAANQTNGSISLSADRHVVIKFSPISVNESPSWGVVGPTEVPSATGITGLNASGKIQAIAATLNYSTIYVGGGNGGGTFGPTGESGVYKTIDGGKTWVAEDNGITDPVINELWLDPANASIVLAGTAVEGIYRSDNAGASWSFVKSASQITYFLDVNGTVYASWNGGILSSTDYGLNWNTFLSANNLVETLAYSKGNMFAGISNGTVLKYNSSSGWKKILNVSGYNVESIAVNASDPNDIFVVEWNSYAANDTYFTSNGGATWSHSDGFIAPGKAPGQYVTFGNSQKVIYIGTDGALYRSADGGTTYTLLPLEVDVRYINASGNDTIIVGSDQGAFISFNGGTSWKSLTANIVSTSLINDLAESGNTIITTVQDFSPIYSFDGGAKWGQLGTNAAIGENGIAAINPANTQWVYEFTGAGFQYSSNGGQSYLFALGTPSPPKYVFHGVDQLIAFSPGNESIVYVVNGSSIEESYNHGENFFVPWSFWSHGDPTLIAVNPSSNQTIYVGNSTALYVTHDNGTSWSECGAVSGTPESIAIDRFNTSILLVASSNGDVYKSTDSCSSFVSVSSGITLNPNAAPVLLSMIAFEPNSQVAAVATAHGTYLSLNLGANWTAISGDIIPWWITGLQWTNNDLYVSAYGEGILKASVSTLTENLYTTTFTESGLPSGTSWSVTYDGTPKSSTSTSISFVTTEGTFSYSVGSITISGCTYTPSPSSGNLQAGNPESVSFSASCGTTFTESGLPSGESWWVYYDGTNKSATSTSIVFTVPSGSYSFSTGSPAAGGCTYTPSPSSGTLQAGTSQSMTFSSKSCSSGSSGSSGGGGGGVLLPPTSSKYTVKFNEIGLPTGANWKVTLGNSTLSSVSGSISFSNVSSGTLLWTTYIIPCSSYCQYIPSPSSGSINVQASITVDLSYTKTEFVPVTELNGTATNLSFHVTASNNGVSLNISALPAAHSIKLRINDSNITLDQLVVNTRSYIAKPQIIITQYATMPSSLPPIKHVLEYLNVSPSFNESAAVNNVTYYLMVPDSDIAAAGTNFTRVSVYRFDGANWTALPTYIVYHNSTATEYEAVSPGMSSYVLAGTQLTQPKLYYTTQFLESGLPANSLWSVRFGNLTESSVTPSRISFNTSYGIFSYFADNISMTSRNNAVLCAKSYYPAVRGEQNVSAGSIVTVLYDESISCVSSQTVNDHTLYIISSGIVAVCAIVLIIYVFFVRRKRNKNIKKQP